jgi:hypothetical protein
MYSILGKIHFSQLSDHNPFQNNKNCFLEPVENVRTIIVGPHLSGSTDAN